MATIVDEAASSRSSEVNLTSVDQQINRFRSRIRLQKATGWIFFIPFGFFLLGTLKYVLGYRVENIAETRRRFREELALGKPLMIACNHLTYVDPLLIITGLGNHWRYFFNPKTMPWNLAASEYSKNPFFVLVCWCFNVIFIHRKGSREHHEAIYQVASELMSQGHPISIFPEGRRSRTGRFDDTKLAYGVGKILSRVPESRVLCLYLRADGQTGHQSFPKRRSRFRISMETLEVKPLGQGREQVHELTQRVAGTIRKLETERLGSTTVGRRVE